MRRIYATIILPALAALAPAQHVAVFPRDFDGVAGDSYESRLPLSNGISRTQMVYESFDLAITDNHLITDVGFRQDDSTASTGKSLQLSIYMGSTTYTAANVTGVFASNYNGATPRTLVFGPAILALPSFTAGTNLQPVWIHLTTPYRYHSNENLIVEYVVTANNNANQAFNYYLDKGTYISPTATFGTGCQSSAGQVPNLTTSGTYLGYYLTFNLSQAPASSLVWLNMNFTPSPPLDVTGFGAPGCTLLVPPVIAVPAQGNTSGQAYFQFLLPTNHSLLHTTVYGQGLIFDLFANNLGFVFSNGARVTVGSYPFGTAVYASGDPNAANGAPSRNNIAVSLFQWN